MTQQTFDQFDQGLAFTIAGDNPNWNFFWIPPFMFYQYFTTDITGKPLGEK